MLRLLVQRVHLTPSKPVPSWIKTIALTQNVSCHTRSHSSSFARDICRHLFFLVHIARFVRLVSLWTCRKVQCRRLRRLSIEFNGSQPCHGTTYHFHSHSLWQMCLILSDVCHANMKGFVLHDFGNFFGAQGPSPSVWFSCVATHIIPAFLQLTNAASSSIFGIFTCPATPMGKAISSGIWSLFIGFLHECSTEIATNHSTCSSSFITEIDLSNLDCSGKTSRFIVKIYRVQHSI